MSEEQKQNLTDMNAVGTNDPTDKMLMKKRGMIVTIAAILVVFIAVMIGVGAYNTPENRIGRHLDLGNRYLEEQNYEQAIVEFDKAIAIDPMSVEAYLGKAQAYEGMGDINMALQILQEGYDETGDVKFLDAMQVINENIAQPVVSEQIEDEIIIENAGEEEAYPVLILEDGIKDMFDNIVQYCLNENYWEAIDVLWSSEFFELAQQCASQREFSYGAYQGTHSFDNYTTVYIKTGYENYHICLSMQRMTNDELGNITFVFLPESGLGGMVSSERLQNGNEEFDTGREIESVKWDGYMICNTKDYNFSGEYILYSVCDQVGVDPDSALLTFVVEHQERGKLKENLYDGTITREDKYDSGTDLISETQYENGIIQPQLTEDGKSYERITYSNWTGEWSGQYGYNEEISPMPRGIVDAYGGVDAIFPKKAPWDNEN